MNNTGLVVQFGAPVAALNNIWIGGPSLYRGTPFAFTVPIDGRITAYQHTINADGGYDSASITMGVSQSEIDDWIENGLGRDVKVYNNNGAVVWEGFVNVVRINKGAASVSRGPLMEIGNMVLVIYTPIVDKEQEDPVTGDQTETPLGYDEDSIKQYGMIEKHISGGQLVDADMYGTYVNEALYLRDAVLVEIKDPQEDITVNFMSPAEPTITLECRGYYDWLGAYVYYDDDDLANDSYLEVSTKIYTILSYDPNGVIWYNEDPDSIEYNPLLVAMGEIRNRFAKNVIEECVSLGDVNGKRWLFYIDEDRLARYEMIPETVEYKIRVTDREQIIETTLGDRVFPWDVQPRRWAALDDFMTSGPLYSDISSNYFRTDAKMMFIESVQYTAPNTVTLTGGRAGRMKQVMAQLGVGG